LSKKGEASDSIQDRHSDLDRRLREYCAAHTALEVETELNAAKIDCARVFNMRDQYEDPHYAAREMTVVVLDRQSGVPIHVYGVVPKMSLTPGRIGRGASSIGDDTTDILARMLGLSEGAIDKLYADGVVHRTEPFTEPQVAAVNP
jgi:crotonobetainyl-CoA:carnitine CoA-transferase CaiB-like acyl-CoA transferase